MGRAMQAAGMATAVRGGAHADATVAALKILINSFIFMVMMRPSASGVMGGSAAGRFVCIAGTTGGGTVRRGYASRLRRFKEILVVVLNWKGGRTLQMAVARSERGVIGRIQRPAPRSG